MRKICIIIMALLAGMVWAKDYTLDDLIQAGLNNAYSLRQKAILLQNANLDVNTATLNLLPELTTSASRSDVDGTYRNKASLNISKTLTLNEPNYFNYRTSLLSRSQAQMDISQTKKELVVNVYKNWLSIIEKQKELAIRQENLKVLNRTKEQTVLQQSLGQKTSLDVNQADINLINAQLTLKSLENQLASLRADLFAMLKLKDEGGDFVESEEVIPSESEALTPSEETPLLIRKLQEDLHKTRLSKLQQHIGLYPSLSLSFSYNDQSLTNDILAFDKYNDSYQISLGLSWTLSSLWEAGGRYAQTKNSLLLSEWAYENSLTTLDNDKANLTRQMHYLQESLTLNQKKLQQANDNLTTSEERYKLGLMSLLDLEQARVTALEASLAVNSITSQILQTVQDWNLLTSQPVLGKY